MSKKENRKIQDFDGLYAFLRHYVDFMLRMAYRRIKYVGLEKVPADGAVIYAPNHTNALMDALVILAMDRKQKVFVARADIFRNPKVAKILRFLKIMPIMRIRDGMDEVRKNTEIIHKSVDVLLDKVPFCSTRPNTPCCPCPRASSASPWRPRSSWTAACPCTSCRSVWSTATSSASAPPS